MIDKLSMRLNRVKVIYKQDGLFILIKRIFAFLLSWFSYENCTFYVNETMLQKRSDTDFVHKIKNFTYKTVWTTQQLDDLINEGFDLSLLDITQARYRIENGAIASFIFIERELAWKGWTAMTEKAKRTFNPYPYKVDFADKEACTGDAWTNPKYRRQGLYTYGFYQRQEYLIAKGVKKTRTITLVSNEAMIKAHDTIGVRRNYAKARYLRIGRLQFWKETPIEATENNNDA